MAIDERVGTVPPGAAGEPELGVGKIISQTFKAVGQNFGVFAPLALVAALPNTAFAGALAAQRMGLLGKNGGNVSSMVAMVVISLVLSLIFGYLLQAAVVHRTFKSMNGEHASFIECFNTSISLLFPLLGLALLASLGIVLGFILLIVPGIILAMMWFVVVPVLVVERTSVGEAFRRSSELTEGYRGSIFLLSLILGIAVVVLGIVLRIFGSASNASSLKDLLPYMALEYLQTSIQIIFVAAGSAVIYYQLRVIKEGIGPEAVASVFD